MPKACILFLLTGNSVSRASSVQNRYQGLQFVNFSKKGKNACKPPGWAVEGKGRSGSWKVAIVLTQDMQRKWQRKTNNMKNWLTC